MSYQEQDEDIKTIEEVIAGNTNAYSIIVEKYQEMIFRYSYSRIKDYDEALDITQEVLIMALEALQSFRKESKFSTWLYSIMVNFCKNYQKKAGRYNVVSLNIVKGNDEYDMPLPDVRENPENSVVMNDSLDIVKEEMNSLPDEYREILVLRDIDGFSYNEIAEMLNINLSNVKVRIHRGREFLKNRLFARGLI